MNLKNDNEFENLFRRAADSFPLNTSGSDWETVLAKLEEKKEKRPFIFINKKLLIVLLCILFIAGGTSLGLFMATKNNVTTVNTASDASNTELEKNKTLANTIGAAVYKKIVDSLKKQQLIDSANNSLSHKNAANNYSISKQALSGNKLSNNQLAYSFKNLPVKAKPVKPFEINIVNNVNDDKNATVINTLKADTANQNKGVTTAAEVVNNVKDTNNLASKNTDTATILNNLTRNAKKKDVKTKFFYAGVMYATDKSALNFEPNKGRGYSLALVLGYQYSSVFSIETGLHIEKKEYYTTGENFNKSIIPATGKVNWIEAENKLIEIPITLKYNFFTKKRYQFFATAGLSSYLINKEYYEYEEEIAGVLQNGFVLYEKNTSNLFATYNFSLGYQFNLKKVGNLRIEPYINLPLKGTGLGNEPVISRGIYLGWIYNFKK